MNNPVFFIYTMSQLETFSACPMGNFDFNSNFKDPKQLLKHLIEDVEEDLSVVLGLATAGIVTFLFVKALTALHHNEKYQRSQGAKNLLGQIQIESETNCETKYVTRKELEEALIHDNKYIVLAGQKGSGKITLLNHVKKRGHCIRQN